MGSAGTSWDWGMAGESCSGGSKCGAQGEEQGPETLPTIAGLGFNPTDVGPTGS